MTHAARSRRRGLPTWEAAVPFIHAAILVGTTACQEAEAPKAPLTVRSEELDARSIPDGDVAGELRGASFTSVDARFRVERAEGRQRVDLYFADAAIERCGLPIIREQPLVWLRVPKTIELAPGEMRVDVGASEPFSVHYQIPADEGWGSVGGGAALLVIESFGAEAIDGRLHACFDDGEQSCVRGHFHATPCVSELDVDDPVYGASHLGARQAARQRAPDVPVTALPPRPDDGDEASDDTGSEAAPTAAPGGESPRPTKVPGRTAPRPRTRGRSSPTMDGADPGPGSP